MKYLGTSNNRVKKTLTNKISMRLLGLEYNKLSNILLKRYSWL